MDPDRWRQIEKLYHGALECAPEERAAFLTEACAEDSDLLHEVEELLGYDGAAESFIGENAMAMAAQELEANDLSTTKALGLAGQQIGAYRILAPLGKGGMGEVHLALDTRLERKVAVKLLPARFTTDAERLRRFAQEARAASALNHPNIITIHEIGEVENTHYIVTEYVEGETLRQRLATSPEKQMKPSEAIEMAAQIAAALSAAHEAGIAHRDIKPENVMVRRDGIVKVLDFGLAKLTGMRNAECGMRNEEAEMLAQPPRDIPHSAFRIPHSTAPGVVMGTASYMSPEQARGEKVDARTDIFSLGVMLYEMIAGRAPFVGATTSEMIAAILRDEPPPLAECAPGAPQELERIIGRALCKERAERYQTAKDLLAELKEVKQRIELEAKFGEAAFGVPPSGGGSHHSSQPAEAGTLNTRRRRATVIAVAALAVAVAAIAGLVVWTYFNRAPVLTSKDTILLADFENKTGDANFDGMLKQGLAIQLQQSPFLNLFPEAQIRHELTLMRRQPNERVTAELAREICERKNLKAFIAGSLAPLGSHYVITLEAVNGQSGEPLANEQVQAESKEQVLKALSQAATRLRERLGESLSSIKRYDRSLQEGTTARPEAFKAYSQGIELAVSGRLREAIPFYQHAVEIDPDFAHAYSQLAIMHWVTGQPGLAADIAKKAYELKARAGEVEKLRITHYYHRFVTGDLNKGIETLLLQRRIYPQEYTGPNDLAGVYNQMGQIDQAIAEAREAIRLNPQFAAPYRYLALALLRLNRFAEAKTALMQALQQKLAMTDHHFLLYQLALIDGDTAGMRQQLDSTKGRLDEYVAFDWQARAASFAGQWRKAQDFSRRAINLTARGDTKEIVARYATEQALRGAIFGDCRRARADAAQGLKLARGRVSLSLSALALALCGEANQAKPLIVELTTRYPEDTIVNSIWLPATRAGLELHRGNAEQAIEQLQGATRYESAAEFWPQHLRGQAYLKLGLGAEATAEFQKILDHRGYAPLSPLYPLAHLGLARAAALTGDTAKSRKAWDDFFAAWKDADAGLPILTEARREYEKR